MIIREKRLFRRRLFIGLGGLFIGLGVSASSGVAEEYASPAEIPVEAFAQLPSTMGLRLSPDGSHIAYLVPYEGRKTLIIKEAAGEAISGVKPPENADINWFKWLNNDKIALSFGYTARRVTTTTLETRLYVVDRDGENLRNLVRPRKKNSTGTRLGTEQLAVQIQDDVIDWLPEDPDHILLAVDGDHNGKSEVRRVNVNNGKFDELTSGFRGIQDYRTDYQHELRLGWGFWKSEFSQMYRFPDSGKWARIRQENLMEKGIDPLAFDKDPAIAYASGVNEEGRLAIYKVNILEDEILEEVFSHSQVDVEDIAVDPLTHRPVGVRYVLHEPEVFYFDKYFSTLQKIIDRALPDTVNRVVSRIKDRKIFLVHATSDVEPGLYYVLDLDNKQLNFLAETLPGITPELMSPKKPVRYKARDGADIPGYLTIPKGQNAHRLPMIIMPHGGPHARTVQSFSYKVQFLASRGYAVFEPNFRGSDGYGPAFRDAGRNQWGGLMQDDVTDGVKWLIEQGIADPDRICIAGSSYGGYAAAMGAIKTPELYQCAVSINGVLNLPVLKAKDKDYIGGRAWTKHMGLEGVDDDEVSPYHRVEELNVPLLIVHAEDDFRVPIRHAEMMAEEMEDQGKDVTFVRLADGDHNLDTEAARLRTLKAMEKFLARHLGRVSQ